MTAPVSARNQPDARRRRVRWTVLVLTLVALAIYAGFMYLNASAGR